MTTNPYATAWRQFQGATAEHKLSTLHSSGLYRHLRMAKPGTGIWHWDIITWPGHLCIDGDIGDGYVFSSEPDMFDFFDLGLRYGTHSDGAPQISFGYWAEKLSRGAKAVKVYSPEKLLARVRQALIDSPARPAEMQEFMECADLVAEFEHDARAWLEGERRMFGTDTWEWDLSDWDHHFLLSCYAIAATVQAVRA